MRHDLKRMRHINTYSPTSIIFEQSKWRLCWSSFNNSMFLRCLFIWLLTIHTLYTFGTIENVIKWDYILVPNWGNIWLLSMTLLCIQKVNSSRSWWSSLTFSWVNPLLQTGVQRQLEQADLLVVPPDLAPQLCCGRLWRCWEQECRRDRGGPSLLWAVFNAYGRLYMLLGLFKVLSSQFLVLDKLNVSTYL